MSQPNDKIELGPIDMIIEDIKVFQVTNIKHPELLGLIGEYGKDDAFAYVQIAYTMENRGDESLGLRDPIESIIFNTKEQVDTAGNEIDVGQDSNTARRTLHGKVKDELVTGIIINKSDPKDIEDIKIITGKINDEEGYSLIESKHASYDFKK